MQAHSERRPSHCGSRRGGLSGEEVRSAGGRRAVRSRYGHMFSELWCGND